MGTQMLATYTSTGITLTTAGAYETPFTITQTGTVDTATGNAVYSNTAGAYLLNEGSIAAAGDGVFLENGGAVTNIAGATITGGDAGVAIKGIGSAAGQNLSNAGLINSPAFGVYLQGDAVSLANTGTIDGTQVGLLLIGGGYVSNAGTLAGNYGVECDDGGFAFTFNNSGTILGGRGGESVGGIGDGTIINAGLVTASVFGVEVYNGGVALDTVINTGTIQSGNFGINLIHGGFGSFAVYNQGSVLTDGTGVELGGFGIVENPDDTLINAGTITGGTRGVYVYEGGTITNTGTASFIFGGNQGVDLQRAGGIIANAGTIASGTEGIYVGEDGTITNTGTIAGGQLGIYFDHGGTVTNAGAASAIVGGDAGVEVFRAAGIISNAGSIGAATFYGVELQQGGTVTNTGTIAGGNDGVYVEFNGGTVTNASGGTITGMEAVRLGNGGGVEDTGTDSQSLDNAGVLLGSAAGGDVVYVRGSVSSVYNSGTIAGGASGTGMYFLGGGYIGNSGTFSGAYGMILTDDPAIAQTFNNTGTVFAAGRGLIASGGNQTIVNQNFIYGGFKGVIISGAGAALDTLINTGTIASQSFGVVTGTTGDVAIFNQGTIGDGVRLQSSGTDTDFILNTGTINGTPGIYVYNASGSQTILNQGTISGFNGILLNAAGSSTTIENAGTIASTLGVNGVAIGPIGSSDGTLTVIVDPNAVFIGSVSGGGGVLEFAAGTGSLGGIGAQFVDFATFALDTGASWTVAGTLDSSSDAVITGFTANDTIDITNLTVPAVSLVTLSGADVLSLEQDADTLNLTFSGDTGTVLTLTSDGGAGTLIEEVTCFLRGTRIRTARGEVPVEELAIGDTVRTLHAGAQRIKWIGMRQYGAPFCNHAKVLPIQIRANAIADGVPARDLFVSPGHAICIDDALIHAARLVNGVTITQAERADMVEYFHIELATHEVILAENCPAETFMGEYFRQQFQNAESFSALYPGAKAPEILSVPFLSHGFQLGAILRRLRARAGIVPPAKPGPLRGYVDIITADSVAGWARDLASPDEPVLLDILADEARLGRVLANIPRPDVAAAGFGRGEHGFEFALPAGTAGRITVRRAADGAALARATQSEAA